MFKKMDRKRLMELAGIEPIQHGPEDRSMSPQHQEVDSDAGLHGEQPEGGDESTEEHLDKETSVFDKVHDALEELLDFLHSQEGFEEKRGKEDEYSEMEHDAEDLKNALKKHLAGYEGDEEGEGEDHEGDEGSEEGGNEDIRMIKPEAKPEM